MDFYSFINATHTHTHARTHTHTHTHTLTHTHTHSHTYFLLHGTSECVSQGCWKINNNPPSLIRLIVFSQACKIHGKVQEIQPMRYLYGIIHPSLLTALVAHG